MNEEEEEFFLIIFEVSMMCGLFIVIYSPITLKQLNTNKKYSFMDLTYQNKKHSTSPSVHLISPSYYKAYVLLTIRANISMNIRYHCSVWKNSCLFYRLRLYIENDVVINWLIS